MFELFNGVSDGELKGIYKDILKSEKDGLRPKSLDSYAKKLQKNSCNPKSDGYRNCDDQ